MNAINDNNEPFEDIFRDRFADFESEPNEILWNKIEPQLPVNHTRRFPYWQTSAVILGLFLGGIYFTKKEKTSKDLSAIISVPVSTNNSLNPKKLSAVASVPTDNHESEPKQKNLHESSENTPWVQSQTTAEGTDNGGLQYLPKSITKKVEQKNIINRNTPLNSNEKYAITKTEIVDNEDNKYSNQSINTKTLSKKSAEEKPSFVASNNFSENPLNPSNLEQSNHQITANSIFEPNNKNLNVLNNSSNTFEPKSVSFNSSQNVSERKINLSILDSKSYGLLANHFKMAKLKFVTVPKEEVYFKERKPLEFYASAMPLLNYYTITPNGNDANYVHNISVNDDGDRIGFYTQAGLVFTLSDRLKLRTGLTFTKTNHSINYRVRTDSLIVQPADNRGVDISFSDLNKIYSQSANYLGTKIEVQYVFLRGEALTHYVSVGGEAAYRLNGNHELNGFANFAYGITRQIGDNAYLFIEPTFSYSLNQQSDNSSLLLVKPNKIGFNIGVNFKIK